MTITIAIPDQFPDQFDGDDNDNTIFGTDGLDLINGFGGDDVITANSGDVIDGGDGFDTAVFSGSFADFSINDAGTIFNLNDIGVTGPAERVTLRNVELLRFDDQDVSVLDFIDDIGDTRETARAISLKESEGRVGFTPFGDLVLTEKTLIVEELPPERNVGFSNGTIDTIDDTDAFTVVLEAGKTYEISVALAVRIGISFGLEIVEVLDPSDTPLTVTADADGNTVSFTAPEDGEYLFRVTGTDETVGDYDVSVQEIRLTGDAFSNDLKGSDADETLFGDAGRDLIDGGGGVDVAVFDGNREDFEVATFSDVDLLTLGPFEEPTEDVFVRDTRDGSIDRLVNVEILRFDDEDVSILEFIDDFGDTVETAGEFIGGQSTPQIAKQLGRIDAIGDVDGFTVELNLDAGDTFLFTVQREENFQPAGPALEADAVDDAAFQVSGIFDPSGNAVALLDATPLTSGVDDVDDTKAFRATEAGRYLFTVAGVDENIGGYFVLLQQANLIGTDEGEFLFGTPLDETYDGKGGDDTILFNGGIDTIDGGEGIDTLQIDADPADVGFSVAEDGTITVTIPNGQATVTNVEAFQFDGFEVETPLEEILDVADNFEEGTDFTIQGGDASDDRFTGDQGSDFIDAGLGADVIIDAGGDNVIDAGEGEDIVALVSGDNTVDGGDDGDLIIGGIGNDDLVGGSGNDVIRGDVSANLFGTDRITGGTGDDLLEGGGGIDTFVFATGDGTDTIGTLEIDFDDPASSTVVGADFVSGLDVVELAGFGFEDADAAFANVTDVDGVATFSDQGTTIIFNGLTTDDLSADDFILV